MKKIKLIVKKVILLIKSVIFLNHDNSNFNSLWNLIRIKHKVFKKEKDDLSFFNLHYNNSLALGPLQKDEAMFVYSLIKCIQPSNAIEFGFNKGHSAFAILSALKSDAKFLTIDINDKCKKIFDSRFKNNFKNAQIIIGDMTKVDFSPSFSLKSVEFVFFDALHDLDLNIITFNNLKPYLSSNCILLIHDTGLWSKKFMHDVHWEILPAIKSKNLNENLIAHQIDERKFANYLIEEEGFKAFHIHSVNILRHGLSILHMQENQLSI